MISSVEIMQDIVSRMMPFINDSQADKLKNICLVVLDDCDISKKETAVVPYDSMSNDLLLKKFCIAKKVEGCSDATIRAYNGVISAALDKIGKQVTQVTSDDIMFYLAKKEIEESCSKVTIDNERRYLSTFFAYLSANDIIAKNPMLKIKKVKTPKRKKKAFTDMEVERIRNACETCRERALVEVMLSTGCRVSEIAAIKIEDARQEKLSIIGKGDKERTVYMNAKALVAVERYIAERSDDNPYLFPKSFDFVHDRTLPRSSNQRKNTWYKDKALISDENANIGQLEGCVRAIGLRAGVSECHPHKFRRTCATFALRRGMPLLQVSKMLGHEQVSTTQIYLDLDEAEIEAMHKKYVT